MNDKPLNIPALLAVAEKATGGDWMPDDFMGHTVTTDVDGVRLVAEANLKADAEFIAAFSPATAIALIRMLQDANSRNDELRSSVIAPGIMRCAGCGLVLTKNNLNMSAGTVTAGDSKSEPCPNGCGPLWPVTWKEQALEMRDDSEKWFLELQESRQRIAELQSVNDELTKFPDQIVGYVARMGTSEIGSHAKDVIYRAAQKVKDRAAGIGKGGVMDNFSKEQLIDRCEGEIECAQITLRNGTSDTPHAVAECLRLFEIAKASIESAPAGYHVYNSFGDLVGQYTDLDEAEKTRNFWNKEWEIRPYFYHAPSTAMVFQNFRSAMEGIGHIRRTLEETFGGLHGTHCEPDVLVECKEICDAICEAYRAAGGKILSARARSVAAALVAEYVSNSGTDSEFISCITPSRLSIGTGGVWDLWKELEGLITDNEVKTDHD